MSARKARRPVKDGGAGDVPTPSELVNIAMQLRPGALHSAHSGSAEIILCEAFGVWQLARQVIANGGKTQEDHLRSAARTIDAATDGGPSPAGKDSYTLQEAWRQLGYKDTRGERSLFELLRAMDTEQPNQWRARGGLAQWVRSIGCLDAFEMRAAEGFKRDREAKRNSAGGKARAARAIDAVK